MVVTIAATLFGYGSLASWAAETPLVDTNRWTGNVAFGLTLTGGNSDTVLGTLGALAERHWPKDELRLGLDGAYGKADGDLNTDNGHVFGQYNRLFTDRFYGSLRGDAIHDDIAEVS